MSNPSFINPFSSVARYRTCGSYYQCIQDDELNNKWQCTGPYQTINDINKSTEDDKREVIIKTYQSIPDKLYIEQELTKISSPTIQFVAPTMK